VILIGIPGLEHVQFWIGLPFFVLCLVALLGNIFLLFITPTDRSLHQPMSIFLAVLAATDLGLCVTIAPKMLAIFWFGSCSMAFNACLTQLFLIQAFQGMESGILLAMVFNRYVAICDPLRHTSIFTPFFLLRVGADSGNLGNSTCWDFTYFTKKTVVFPLCGYCPFLL
jgi:olfactory receptor